MTTEVPPADAEHANNHEAEGANSSKAVVPEEKKEEDKPSTASAAATPKKSATPTDSILPVNMPNSMMTPNNRPPSRSSLSVQSAGSTGGRTTTSRRGGRTRSRSPTAGHNMHSSNLQPYGGRPPSTTPSVPSEIRHQGMSSNNSVPPSPCNPSAAAAAAAAAAKSFRNPSAGAGNRGSSASGGASSSMHPSGMHYPPHQQQPPYGGASGGPSSMRDPYGRQAPQGRQDPYSSRYPGGPPGGQRQPQRPPSSASTSYPGGQSQQQQQQRPHSRTSASYSGGPPPPGYYDPHNGNRNPSSSSHHQYHQQHPRSNSRAGPPPPGSRYDSQGPSPGVGPDGRPLSRNSGPSDPQNPYGYNPYHRNSGAPSSSRGGMPPGNGRDYGSQYSGSNSSRYGGPAGSGSGSSGPVDSGEYSRQHHTTGSSSSSSRHGHTAPPHHRQQYQGGGPPPHPSGHHQQTSSSRGGRQSYPGSSGSGNGNHHTSYRHGDPNTRGPPPPHYRGGPQPPSHQTQHSSRGGPPPGHPDYHRYHSQQQQLKQQKGGESMVKSTRTVIGTATPLHLNKGGPLAPAPAPPGGPQPPQPKGYHGSSIKNSINNNIMNSHRDPMASSPRRGTAASVFRGRPGPVESGSSSQGNNSHHQSGASSNSNNPKSILDSLETPSNSFEEKKSCRVEGGSQQAKDSQQELSLEDPPKLRNPANNASTDSVFDPQRSPKSQATGAAGITMSPPQLTNSLDMAPSFSLFNQSFDSLGDTAQFFNVSGALDSAMLNSSTSFELKQSGSRSPSSPGDNCLQLSASSGTFKLNASMSGGAIFGMSPTNSFGNGPTASFSTNTPGGPSVTVLGGNSDGRSSPSQVLDLYKNSGSIEEVDLRLSASLGSPMIGASHSYSSSRPFATGVEGGPSQPSLGGGDIKSSGSGLSSNRRSHLSPRPQRRYSGVQSHPSYRPQRSSSAGPPNKDGSPRFYNFLRTNKDAFADVTFLLPELKEALMESKNNSKGVKNEEGNNDGMVSNENTPKRGRRSSRYDRTPTETESIISRRRIVSAVCAFGGTFIGSRMNNPINNPSNNIGSSDTSMSSSSNKVGLSKSNSQSIFREKSSEPVTVTPNSSGSSSAATPAKGAGENATGSKASPEQVKYDRALPTRYYESDNRLSWEFEENPPIGTNKVENFKWCQEVSIDDENDGDEKLAKKRKMIGEEGEEGAAGDGDDDSDDDDDTKEGEEGDESNKSKDGKGESPKMRYRCKLCGQPKTNHVCPYQQSLVRSIGAMVQPAVNAFTAAEPGQLAPDLKEMNNLAISAAAVAAENSSSGGMDLVLPSRPTPDRSSIRQQNTNNDGDGIITVTSVVQVTPESLRSGVGGGSDNTIIMSPGGRSSSNHVIGVGTPGGTIVSSSSSSRRRTPGTTPRKNKRSHTRMTSLGGVPGTNQADLLFVEEMELQLEQFRTVTPSKSILENPDAFTYPALPLPYAQRKRLSDNLFSLSKEIPQLTDECAAVLREARERDLWDLAVAELMTQVVVVVHCHEGDNSFEGLRRYLLTLGFTC